MKKRISIIVCLLFIGLVLVTGCGISTQSDIVTNEKIKVVTTIYPVFDFVRQVGGDKVEVSMMIQPGVEPHDWEPTAKDLAQIRKAKLFFYHGAGLEPADKLLSPEVLGQTMAVEVSKGVKLLSGERHDHDHQHKDDDHDHGSVDIHTWLDPVNAQQEVQTITQALIAVDAANASYYQENAQRFTAELAKLDQEYQAAVAHANQRDIVTSHAAFGYLAERYGLKEIAVMGLSPDAQPSAEKMAEIIQFCRAHNVKYIFFETLVSPKISETIAAETGASLLVLNPIENLTADEVKQGKNYLSIMRDNLKNLKIALGAS